MELQMELQLGWEVYATNQGKQKRTTSWLGRVMNIFMFVKDPAMKK